MTGQELEKIKAQTNKMKLQSVKNMQSIEIALKELGFTEGSEGSFLAQYDNLSPFIKRRVMPADYLSIKHRVDALKATYNDLDLGLKLQRQKELLEALGGGPLTESEA